VILYCTVAEVFTSADYGQFDVVAVKAVCLYYWSLSVTVLTLSPPTPLRLYTLPEHPNVKN